MWYGKKCLSGDAVQICCLQGGIHIIGRIIYYVAHGSEYINQVPNIDSEKYLNKLL